MQKVPSKEKSKQNIKNNSFLINKLSQPSCFVGKRIIDHLKLNFIAEKPRLHVLEQVVLMAAEENAEYLS
jgi:hypothetical protein